MCMKSEQTETLWNSVKHLSGSKIVYTLRKSTFTKRWNTLEHMEQLGTP
jgi:hypothetical protein